MQGLKNVNQRHSDALTRVGWDQLEVLLAVYYRGQGYAVEHCGTGASGTRFDGGIDLKLRKDDAYIIVQCKHWNAKQVPHNPVHELIGVMATQGATGGIFVTSGEYTRAAIEAAAKQGHVELVDGNDLRAMLGPLPEELVQVPVANQSRGFAVQRVAATVGQRLLGAAEDRIRYGAYGRKRGGRGIGSMTMRAAVIALLLKLAVAMVAFLILWFAIQSVLGSMLEASQGRSPALRATQQSRMPAQQPATNAGALRGMDTTQRGSPELIDHYTGTTIQDGPRGGARYRAPTDAQIRESKRKADEAARIIEASTPAM